MNNMKHNGKNTHRLSSNHTEKSLHEAWQKENDLHNTLEYILGEANERCDLSERDVLVAATVIQWLGTTVGNNFLLRVKANLI